MQGEGAMRISHTKVLTAVQKAYQKMKDEDELDSLKKTSAIIKKFHTTLVKRVCAGNTVDFSTKDIYELITTVANLTVGDELSNLITKTYIQSYSNYMIDALHYQEEDCQ